MVVKVKLSSIAPDANPAVLAAAAYTLAIWAPFYGVYLVSMAWQIEHQFAFDDVPNL